jgi:hypothetical protein
MGISKCKKVLAGCIATVNGDDKICIGLIRENDDDEYKLVISRSFMLIRKDIVDISDYDVMDSFDNVIDALRGFEVASIALKFNLSLHSAIDTIIENMISAEEEKENE